MSKESNEPEKINESGHAQSPEGDNAPPAKAPQMKRRASWTSSYAAIKYVSSIPRKRFRYSDKVTDILAGVLILLCTLLIFVPIDLLKLPLTLLCDVLFTLTIVFYIMNRLGILTTLSERQAVLVWDMVLGAFLLGILAIINLSLFVNFIRQIPNLL